MALNENIVLFTPFAQIFRDKDTGLPLRGGRIEFFRDSARGTPKPVYRISGAPGNYTFTSLGNIITLDNAGVVSDGTGTEINLYLFPYDGDVTTPDTPGDIDLYFAQVYSADDVLQTTYEALPNTTGAQADDGTLTENFICNGQFLLHTQRPPVDGQEAGYIPNVTSSGGVQTVDIAYGGWKFVREDDASSNDYITFERIPLVTPQPALPAANPRYYLKFDVRTAVSTPKYLALQFDNVERFSSPDNDQDTYTLQFTGQSTNLATVTLDLLLRRNYGTGGSSQSDSVVLTTFSLTPTIQNFTYSFTIPRLPNKNLGSKDDDFIQFLLRLPTNSTSSAQLTDVMFSFGEFDTLRFPPTTNREALQCGLGGGFPIPAQDGSDIGLPIVLSESGLAYDKSSIGKIFITTASPGDANNGRGRGELFCDGAQYDTFGTNIDDNLPYKRLFDKIGNGFGNGEDYVFNYSGNPNSPTFFVASNQAATYPIPADVSSGFTFSEVHPGTATGYYVDAVMIGEEEIFVITQQNIDSPVNGDATTNTAVPHPPTSNSSGFTIEIDSTFNGFNFDYSPPADAGGIAGPNKDGAQPNRPLGFTISGFPANASALGGQYFNFDSYNTGTRIEYYVWYNTGGSSDPTPAGRTGIEIKLNPLDEGSTIARLTQLALRGFSVYQVTAQAGSSITAGNSWTFDTTARNYYVWYKIDDAGTDPSIADRIGIQVDITSTDTASVVAEKTRVAINGRYYAVPDLRGIFIRGVDNGRGLDPAAQTRFSLKTDAFGDKIGTIQYYEVQRHMHPRGDSISGPDPRFRVFDTPEQPTTDFNIRAYGGFGGGAETRPVNIALNYVIKY